MIKNGVLSIWLGRAEPDGEAIDAFYESRGIGADVLGNGKDENCVNTRGRDIEDVIAQLPFSSSFAEDVVALARRKGIDAPRWISVLYDYAHVPTHVDRSSPDDPIFIGVFDYSPDE